MRGIHRAVFSGVMMGAMAGAMLAGPALAQGSSITVGLGHNSNGSTEVYTNWRGAGWLYGLEPVVGASFSTRSEGWVGAGLGYTWRASANPVFARVAVMPGLYRRGNGRDLGGTVMFRSSFEMGMRLRGGGEVALGVAHRSNAGIYDHNPGMNTVFMGYSIPLN